MKGLQNQKKNYASAKRLWAGRDFDKTRHEMFC